jgi:DNA mismatch repair protein MutL
MADVIQLLPDAIANQIAAGEVIQRPASLVKELLENAVDAGSKNIKLIVKDAGRTLVQVIDDGCGMTESDARLSFERHATSKIRTADDLFAIRTMGFRGEALASIASVARVELRTRQHMAAMGTHVVMEASEIKTQEPCQTAPGTSIAVKNLFFNVPARRAFLKSDTVEFKHILTEFERIAIAHPDVFFSIHHNNNEIMHLPAGNLRQRLTNVFRSQLNQNLVPVNEETDVMRLSGFVGKPEYAKKTRGEQLFFVNGRFIKSPHLHHAVMTAYENVLPKESFPFYALFINIDPSNIDVNVHPTKQEIKFNDDRLVYNYLRVAVRHALGQYAVMPSLDFDQEVSFNVSYGGADRTRQDFGNLGGSEPKRNGESVSNPFRDKPDRREQSNLQNWQSLYQGVGQPTEQTDADDDEPTDAGNRSVTIGSSLNEEDSQDETLHSALSQVRKAPYQIHAAYIVSQIKSGFLLIDQQAAHERILFEKYLNLLSERKSASQQQLFPTTVTLTPNDALLLRDLLSEIQILGFDIQEFGVNSFVVNGLPAELAGQQDEREMIETLLEQHKAGLALQTGVRESIARSIARSAAIKRGKLLSEPEMQGLIDQLFACELPYRSPFGRKCFTTYKLEDLEKQFDH